MNEKKTFIGFDLGDEESIMDYVTLDSNGLKAAYGMHFIPMTMPGSNTPGRAIPTAYGYDDRDNLVLGRDFILMQGMIHDIHTNFKRRPSDLIPQISTKRRQELLEKFSKAATWPLELKECNTPEMTEFRMAIITFTNAVFENLSCMEKIKSESAESSEIVFAVGYPAKWDDLDIAVYKLILQGSVLGKGTYAGKKTSLILTAESRAAYLTVDQMTSAVLPKGTSALLIDAGSSTISLTAVTSNSHKYQYYSENNYLGACGIDYLIGEFYLEKLRKRGGEDYALYKQITEKELDFKDAVTRACRLAKEDVYSSDIGIGLLSVGEFVPVRIRKEEVEELIEEKELAPVLQKYANLPMGQVASMKGKSWALLYEEFLKEQKKEIARRNIRIGRIILTGSASKMPVVKTVVKKVFSELPEGGILSDMDPSRLISIGLALSGKSKGGNTEMNEKKTFIGFDLGDGESIMDYVTLDSNGVKGAYQTTFIPMTMPGSNTPGRAIPTVYGYDESGHLAFSKSITLMPDMIHDIRTNFKRRPSDLIPQISAKRRQELLEKFSKAATWPLELKECNTPEMTEFRTAVVTFTNAVFENSSCMEKIKSEAVDSKEIVFAVGHPTKWDDLDIAVYKLILQGSVLGKGTYAGKKTSLILAAESRAAYLTVKDKTTSAVLPKGTSALLVDVGSSTIDLTAVTSNSHNYQYNSGNNYLGARGIDYLIRELYLEKLRKKGNEDYAIYEQIAEKAPDFKNAVTLACRLAKEDVYSSDIGIGLVSLGDFAPVRIRKEEVEELIEEREIASVLQRYTNLPMGQAASMKGKSWAFLYEEFLKEQKKEIARRNIRIGRIILTGSASKMPVVKTIVKKVFSELPDGGILSDMDPSRSISMGLALVGPSNEKSIAFQKDLSILIEKELPSIIDTALPDLADVLSDIINRRVMNLVKKRLQEWRNGTFTTLNDMNDQIKRDCSQKKLADMLQNDEEYKNAITTWVTEVVGKNVAVKLKAICEKYGVREFTMDNLNIFKVPDVNMGSVNVDVLDFMNAIIAVVAVVTGIITAIVLPTVLGIVIGLIAAISTTIASVLITILLAIPGPGYAVLIAIGGVLIFKKVKNEMSSAKDELTRRVQAWDLPQWVRNRMTDTKIDTALSDANMKYKIHSGILKPKSKKEITKNISDSLKGQIEKRAEDIKYVIESK